MKMVLEKLILLVALIGVDYLIWQTVSAFVHPIPVPINIIILFIIFNIVFLYIIFKSQKNKSIAPGEPTRKPQGVGYTELNFWIVIPGLTVLGFFAVRNVLSMSTVCSIANNGIPVCTEPFLKLITIVLIIALVIVVLSIKKNK